MGLIPLLAIYVIIYSRLATNYRKTILRILFIELKNQVLCFLFNFCRTFRLTFAQSANILCDLQVRKDYCVRFHSPFDRNIGFGVNMARK